MLSILQYSCFLISRTDCQGKDEILSYSSRFVWFHVRAVDVKGAFQSVIQSSENLLYFPFISKSRKWRQEIIVMIPWSLSQNQAH